MVAADDAVAPDCVSRDRRLVLVALFDLSHSHSVAPRYTHCTAQSAQFFPFFSFSFSTSNPNLRTAVKIRNREDNRRRDEITKQTTREEKKKCCLSHELKLEKKTTAMKKVLKVCGCRVIREKKIREGAPWHLFTAIYVF